MSNPPDPLVGKVLADRFQILERIGEGGTGIVYKARQTSVGRLIAIKILSGEVAADPSWVRRFSSEARTAAQLDSPHTIRIIDSGQSPEGLLYIAMELLSGRSLHTELAKVGRMPVDRALRILIQMCESLEEAHRLGIIHRDIKPENIFILEGKGGGDFVKVIDFSIAKVDDDASMAATRAGMIIGTPAYMSPEQALGQKLTIKSDLYACGIVVYEMLAGRPPFQARLPMEIVMMQMRERPAPLKDVPEPVAQLVMKALEKNPAARHESAAALGAEAERCLSMLGLSMQAPPAPMTGSLPVFPAALPPPPAPPSGGPVPVMVAGPGGRTVALDAGPLPSFGPPPQMDPLPGMPKVQGGRTVALDAGGFQMPAPASQGALHVMAPAHMPGAPLPAPPRSRAALLGVGVLLALGLCGGVAYHVLKGRQAQPPAPPKIVEKPAPRRTPPPEPEEEEEKPVEKVAAKPESEARAAKEASQIDETHKDKGQKGQKGHGRHAKAAAAKGKKPAEKKAEAGKRRGKKKEVPGINALF